MCEKSAVDEEGFFLESTCRNVCESSSEWNRQSMKSPCAPIDKRDIESAKWWLILSLSVVFLSLPPVTFVLPAGVCQNNGTVTIDAEQSRVKITVIKGELQAERTSLCSEEHTSRKELSNIQITTPRKNSLRSEESVSLRLPVLWRACSAETHFGGFQFIFNCNNFSIPTVRAWANISPQH